MGDEDSFEPEMVRVGLSPAARQLLWAIRLWVIGQRSGTPVTAVIEQEYAKSGIRNPCALLDEFLGTLGRWSKQKLITRAPCCRQMTPDEQRILRILALAQQGQFSALARLVPEHFDRAGVSEIIALAYRLTAVWWAAGHDLAVEVEAPTPTAPQRPADDTSITVH